MTRFDWFVCVLMAAWGIGAAMALIGGGMALYLLATR